MTKIVTKMGYYCDSIPIGPASKLHYGLSMLKVFILLFPIALHAAPALDDLANMQFKLSQPVMFDIYNPGRKIAAKKTIRGYSNCHLWMSNVSAQEADAEGEVPEKVTPAFSKVAVQISTVDADFEVPADTVFKFVRFEKMKIPETPIDCDKHADFYLTDFQRDDERRECRLGLSLEAAKKTQWSVPTKIVLESPSLPDKQVVIQSLEDEDRFINCLQQAGFTLTKDAPKIEPHAASVLTIGP